MKSARMLAAVVALVALPVLAAPRDAAPRNEARTVEFIEGDVTLVKPDGTRSQPKVGDLVPESDSGANGEVHLNMMDSGYIAAGGA